MRAGMLLCVVLMGCSKEPSFDEQFEKQSAEIKGEAKKLERDLKTQIDLVPEAAESDDNSER